VQGDPHSKISVGWGRYREDSTYSCFITDKKSGWYKWGACLKEAVVRGPLSGLDPSVKAWGDMSSGARTWGPKPHEKGIWIPCSVDLSVRTILELPVTKISESPLDGLDPTLSERHQIPNNSAYLQQSHFIGRRDPISFTAYCSGGQVAHVFPTRRRIDLQMGT